MNLRRIVLKTVTYAALGAWCALTTVSPAAEWTPPATLNSYASIDSEIIDSRVEVATDGADTAISIWLQNASNDGDYSKIYLSRSSNAGQTWSIRDLMFQQTSDDQLLLAASTIHLGGDRWIAAWITAETANEGSQTFYVSHSHDDGQTWLPPVVALDKPLFVVPPGTFRFGLDADLSGTVIASVQSQILMSDDYGESWIHIETPATFNLNPFTGDQVNERDFGSRIGFCGDGKWINGFFRNSRFGLDFEWKFYQTVSTDNGFNWTEPRHVPLSNDQSLWFGDMAVDGNTILLVYKNNQHLSFARSTDAGTSWENVSNIDNAGVSDMSEISLALNDGDAALAFDFPLNAYGTSINVSHSANTGSTWSLLEPLSGGPGNLTPSIAAGPDDTFLLHYENMTRPVGYHVLRQINAIRSTDGGSSWDSAQQLNAGAPGELDIHVDTGAYIAAGDNGVMLAAWNVTSVFGNGEVGHIAYAISHDYGMTWEDTRPLYATNGSFMVKPQLAYNGDGRWFACWEQNNATVASISTDNAATWSVPAVISAGPNVRVLDSNEQGTMLAASTTGYWRSDDSGATWTSAGAVRYGLAAHNLGGGSWIGIENKKVFASADNGFNWTQVGTLSGQYPEHSISIDSSDDGTLVAVLKYSATCYSNSCAGPLSIARSTDGGVTWVYTTIVSGIHPYDGIRDESNITAAWLGHDKWIVTWTDHPPLRTSAFVTSEDDGVTWSQPAEIQDINGFENPVVAVKDGHATVVVGATVKSSEFLFRRFVILDDITYSNLLQPSPAAATDWALFE